MSLRDLPSDINRLIAGLPDMTIGDIRALCRTHRAFNEAVCRQNNHFSTVLREARERLTDYYDVVKKKTFAELEEDLALPQETIRDIRLLRRRGYKKPSYDRFTRMDMLNELYGYGFQGLGNQSKAILMVLLDGVTPKGYSIQERHVRREDEAPVLYLVRNR